MGSPGSRQKIVTLDLEGVLVPEVWVAMAEATGIEALARTTRDEPDYDILMGERLATLSAHGLGIGEIGEVISTLAPLEGAKAFLDELRSVTQVVILSDTFEEFARPFMAKLGWPTIFCHRLEIDDDAMITDYRLRQPDQKRQAVKALHSLEYKVIAAGDSYNDTTMLSEADHGFLFGAPHNVIAEFPQFPALETYNELSSAIGEILDAG